MGRQSAREGLGREAFAQHLVQEQERRPVVARCGEVGEVEVGVVIEDVQRAGHFAEIERGAAEGHRLVEHAERVAHTAVGFRRDEVQRFVVVGDSLLAGDVFQVGHTVLHADAVEVVDLATGEDGGDDLVFLGRGEDEDGVCGRLFEGLEEGVEGRLREHVHLVDDVDAVAAYLRRDAHLFGQGADVVHRVVRCGVQLVYVETAPLVEGATGFACAAGLAVVRVEAVDGLGEYAGAGGLAYAARTAEQVGVGQLAAGDGVAERGGDMRLPDH